MSEPIVLLRYGDKEVEVISVEVILQSNKIPIIILRGEGVEYSIDSFKINSSLGTFGHVEDKYPLLKTINEACGKLGI